MSKLGVHINFITEADAMREFILSAHPTVVKTLHHDAGFWREIKTEYPELLLIGRRHVESQPLDDPEKEADTFARSILNTSTASICDAWEGYNESGVSKLKKRCRFDIRLAQRLHEAGLDYVAGSWSVGVPEIASWQKPEMLDALRMADYIGVHEYCAPRMDDPRGLDTSTDPLSGWFTLRYRKWYPSLPPDCQKPVLITECGIDSGACHWDLGAQGGWRSFTDAQGYLGQLEWYDQMLQQDKYIAGATIFCWGTLDPTWSTYDLKGDMSKLLKSYLINQQQPPAPPSPPTWVDMRAVLPHHPTLQYERRSLANISEVVIHHVGAVLRVGSGEELCQRIAEYHVRNLGWPGIGYHFVISFGGQVFWVNDLETVSYHCAPINEQAIGICLEGCFLAGETPPEPNQFQIAATNKLLEQIRAQIRFAQPTGHQDWVATLCPGETWPTWKFKLLWTGEPTEIERLRDLLAQVEQQGAQIVALAQKRGG